MSHKPPWDVLVGLAVAVTVVQNSAFHAGALQASVPIMSVGEPVVAVLLGVAVLGEQLAVGGSGTLALFVAVWAMAAAAIALSRSQAIEVASQPTREPSLPSTSGAARLAGVSGKRN